MAEDVESLLSQCLGICRIILTSVPVLGHWQENFFMGDGKFVGNGHQLENFLCRASKWAPRNIKASGRQGFTILAGFSGTHRRIFLSMPNKWEQKKQNLTGAQPVGSHTQKSCLCPASGSKKVKISPMPSTWSQKNKSLTYTHPRKKGLGTSPNPKFYPNPIYLQLHLRAFFPLWYRIITTTARLPIIKHIYLVILIGSPVWITSSESSVFGFSGKTISGCSFESSVFSESSFGFSGSL